jgi:hypothetical protein
LIANVQPESGVPGRAHGIAVALPDAAIWDRRLSGLECVNLAAQIGETSLDRSGIDRARLDVVEPALDPPQTVPKMPFDQRRQGVSKRLADHLHEFKIVEATLRLDRKLEVRGLLLDRAQRVLARFGNRMPSRRVPGN